MKEADIFLHDTGRGEQQAHHGHDPDELDCDHGGLQAARALGRTRALDPRAGVFS